MPFPRALRRLLLAPLAAGLGLLALEGLARLGGAVALRWAVPSSEVRDYIENNRVVYDPALGWRPAAVGGELDTMWMGLGAANLPARPPPGRVRVFTFGDSQTQGGGVHPTQAWPAVAEAALRAQGRDIEVINAGAPGYRSAQVLSLIESRVLAWSPDVLVVDCRLNDSAARPAPDSLGPLRAALFQSRLYRLAWLGVASLRGQDLGLPGGLGGRPTQPYGDEAEGPGNHAAIASVAATWGLDLVFVDYPHLGGRPRVLAAGADPAQLPPGVPVVRATDALRASGQRNEALFFDINHLTVAGNVVVGEAVAAVLGPLVDERR